LSTYKIEKGVPMPPTSLTSVLREMEVGDSIVISIAERANIYKFGTDAGIKVKTSQVDTQSVRVWRIA
jgi:hypothetical protein